MGETIERIQEREKNWRVWLEDNAAVFFITDPGFHGWTHTRTNKLFESAEEAARDFLKHSE